MIPSALKRNVKASFGSSPGELRLFKTTETAREISPRVRFSLHGCAKRESLQWERCCCCCCCCCCCRRTSSRLFHLRISLSAVALGAMKESKSNPKWIFLRRVSLGFSRFRRVPNVSDVTTTVSTVSYYWLRSSIDRGR